ncbi:MAG: IS66 family transposase [Ktedonobacterales bacterium]
MTLEEDRSDRKAENVALRQQNELLQERDRLRQQAQSQLQRLNEGLQARVTQLEARVRELEARLAKDSHNSGKPPSSDGLKRQLPRTRSLRRASGKRTGGQLGHPGETLQLVTEADGVVEHRPSVCAACQTPLAAGAEVVGMKRRQVRDLPPVRLQVTEHQALRVRCPTCRQVSDGAFPAEAPSRAQYGPRLRALAVYLVEHQLLPYERACEVLADVCGAPLSEGTLAEWLQQSAAALKPVEAAIKVALGQAPVLHHDETGVRRMGKLAWAHVTCTDHLTHYAIHAKRGREATEAIGILPGYQGVSVHDGWKPYQAYTQCRHALCNVHHLRELTYLEEQFQQPWATEMKALLREMKTVADAARAQGALQVPQVPPPIYTALVVRYQALLAAGLAANPPPGREPKRRGRRKQSPARNLLQRLWLQQDHVLAFLDDLTIPFDNNQAERDVRMLKTQQKVSGGFRSEAGAQAFARLRGYLSTLRKQGIGLLDALRSLFTGAPLYPALG